MSRLFAFTMPKWGIEMDEGVVAEWLVQEGESFGKGAVLMAVETEKIVNDIEAELDGVVLRQIAEAGETYPVGALLGVLGPAGTPQSEVDSFVSSFVAADTAHEPTESEREVAPAPASAYEIPRDLEISPKAEALAKAKQLPLESVTGSGRGGRIQLQDVQQHAKGAGLFQSPGKPVDNQVLGLDWGLNATPVALDYANRQGLSLDNVSGSGKAGRIRLKDLPKPVRSNKDAKPKHKITETLLSGMRLAIGKKMSQAYREIPHFYLEAQVNVTQLLEMRQRLNESSSIRVSINDCLVKACGDVLIRHDHVNARLKDEVLQQYEDANVAIAVALPDGLITPVVHQANQLSLSDLASQSKTLLDKAKKGQLSFTDLSHGTFTVSNLGMYGVSRFTAIINAPQTAILSVGGVQKLYIPDDTGFSAADMMPIVLGCDHRVLDGATGGEFLADLKTTLENPESWLK